jgi:AcrR family transcriptional regulator
MPVGGKRAGNQGRAARGERKHLYLSQAKQFFAEFGYAAATFDQIAEACGVTRSVLARSFRDKAAFLRALGGDWIEALFPPPADNEPAADVVHRLQEFTERFLGVMSADRQAAGVLLTGLAEPADPEEATIVREVVHEVVEKLMPIMQEGQQAGVIRRDLDPKETAANWMRFLLGAALLPPAEVKEGEAQPHIAETLLHGVLKTDV